MTQITQAKLKELNVLQLYEHYGALERSLPLLTPESQELAKAELEACAHLRSEKIDRIYYAMAAHEDAIDRIKKESDLITKAHYKSFCNKAKGSKRIRPKGKSNFCLLNQLVSTKTNDSNYSS